MALAYPDFAEHQLRTSIAALVLLGYALFRTLVPMVGLDGRRTAVEVMIELAINVAVVSSTGGWESPFTFSLVTAVIVAGFARGFAFSLATSTVSVVAVEITELLQPSDDPRTAAQWAVELFLVAVVTGYARRISGERELEQSLALTRIGKLADANALLFSLHRVAQTLPASLDLDEALDSTIGRLRELFDYSAAAVLVLDDTDGSWIVGRREGSRMPPRIVGDELPPPMKRCLALRSVVNEANLLSSGGPGLAPSLVSGLYGVLRARGAVIGLVSIEHNTTNHFTERDAELLEGFLEPAALAVDNARWFGRLRTVGAEEERNRIARDLHDRIGQSLAYLAFELDRIVKTSERGDAVHDSLEQLRTDVRTVIREVRDTLYDLRTDVSVDQSFLATLELFLVRVRERSALAVMLRSEENGRLAMPQERELFRIAQEAITNVERHADADQVTVTWTCDGRRAMLEIADNGQGFPVGRAGRLDSYGLLGMRERAASIGATFDIQSEVGHGTRIRCLIAPGRSPAGQPSPS